LPSNLRGTAARPHAISDRELKPTQTVLAFIHNRVFCTDVLFIRTENTVGARSAQWSFGNNGGSLDLLRSILQKS